MVHVKHISGGVCMAHVKHSSGGEWSGMLEMWLYGLRSHFVETDSVYTRCYLAINSCLPN